MEQPVDITLVIAHYETPLYCLRCKCPLFTHLEGKVLTNGKIIPPCMFVCPNPRCQLPYNFRGFVKGIEGATKNFTVGLHKEPNKESIGFHCPECRTTVFKYEGVLLSLVPGKTDSPPGVITKCPDSRCGINFMVSDF